MAISGRKITSTFHQYGIASDADKREPLRSAEQQAAGSNVVPLKQGEKTWRIGLFPVEGSVRPPRFERGPEHFFGRNRDRKVAAVASYVSSFGVSKITGLSFAKICGYGESK